MFLFFVQSERLYYDISLFDTSASNWPGIKSKDSFEILRMSRFQNWPYFFWFEVVMKEKQTGTFFCGHGVYCYQQAMRLSYNSSSVGMNFLTRRLMQFRHEWVQEIHTHTRAVAGKSFPNVLTVREIPYPH